MAKTPNLFNIPQRKDTNTFQITLNPVCGLPERVCDEWKRKSFMEFPPELADYRIPKDEKEAKAGAIALIFYLKKKQEEEGSARNVKVMDVRVGAWIEKFTAMETSPRTGINAAKNKPYSIATLNDYKDYYENHIKNDPITNLKMAEVEEEDIIQFCARMAVEKIAERRDKDGKVRVPGRTMGGTRTYKGVVVFVRMTFNNYQRKNHKWVNPFQGLDSPKYKSGESDWLPEDEMVKLFMPGVLKGTMELVVCGLMFLSGLRRAEVFALKPEDLDWATPKITIRNAWQLFNSKNRVLGPPKSKKPRDTFFDEILQAAIKKLWAENGQHEYVCCRKDGSIPGPTWIKANFPKWLKRAKIDLGGRKIKPHGSRHSLASYLETKGVPIRYIQELLGHSDKETTKIYLHKSEKALQEISKKITEAREKKEGKKKADTKEKREATNVIPFRKSS